jgi:ABC-type branched-subunit amino acid transport system substrate-binding protein
MSSSAPWRRVIVASLALAGAVTACSSTSSASSGSAASSTSATSSGGSPRAGPAPNAETTGVTSKQVTLANVSILSGPVPGLFEGAPYGTQAFFAYVNSKGGVYGRKLVLKTGDDGFSCANNQSETASYLHEAFAFVGSFSLFDNCGARSISTVGDLPDVHEALDPTAQAIANNFSPQPVGTGWRTGPLVYYRRRYPSAVTHVGALVSNVASAVSAFNGYQATAKSLGYKVVYTRDTNPLETDFTSDIIRMRSAGVQFLVLFLDINSIARVLNAAQQQGWHPRVVTSAGQLYDKRLFKVADSGAANGALNDQTVAMYQGEDRSSSPEVNLFLTWLGRTHPGFTPDIYTVYGWASARLFVQALRAAGPSPTRAAVMSALREISSFDSNGLIAPDNPARKVPPTCWMLAVAGQNGFRRVSPRGSGFRCDGTYLSPAHDAEMTEPR